MNKLLSFSLTRFVHRKQALARNTFLKLLPKYKTKSYNFETLIEDDVRIFVYHSCRDVTNSRSISTFSDRSIDIFANATNTSLEPMVGDFDGNIILTAAEPLTTVRFENLATYIRAGMDDENRSVKETLKLESRRSYK